MLAQRWRRHQPWRHRCVSTHGGRACLVQIPIMSESGRCCRKNRFL